MNVKDIIYNELGKTIIRSEVNNVCNMRLCAYMFLSGMEAMSNYNLSTDERMQMQNELNAMLVEFETENRDLHK